MRITTLIENTQGEHLGLKIEHGISFFIEKDDKKLLFDLGQNDSFIYNASQLKIDLSDLDYVVLSHGHYDHTGGFKSLLEIMDKFELIMGQGFFDPKFGYKNNCYEYLGNNFDESDLKCSNLKYRFVSARKTELTEGIYVITDFQRTNKGEIVNPRFVLRKDGLFIPDPFNDELLLAIETDKGIVVIVGCSHPGIRNMLDTVKAVFNKPIYAVLGGTHLVEAHGTTLDQSIKYLCDSQTKILGVSHCTGKEAMSQLEKVSASYFHNSTGSSVYIDF